MKFMKWYAKHPTVNMTLYAITVFVSYYLITDYNYLNRIIGGMVLVISTIIAIVVECNTNHYYNNQKIES